MCDTLNLMFNSMPPPPNYKPSKTPPPLPQGEAPEARIPIMETQADGTLDDDETSFILRTTLIKRHMNDPNVLRYISNYMRCRNNAQASLESGLAAKDGHYLRNRPDIHLAINRLTAKSVNKYGFDASEIVERVKEISDVDPVHLQKADGSYVEDLSKVPPEVRRAIKKFKAKNIYGTDPNGMRTVTGQMIEVEFWDKMKAHEMLGREKELFKETKKVEHDVTSNMKDFLLESRKRADLAIANLKDVSPPLSIEGRVDDDINLDQSE